MKTKKTIQSFLFVVQVLLFISGHCCRLTHQVVFLLFEIPKTVSLRNIVNFQINISIICEWLKIVMLGIMFEKQSKVIYEYKFLGHKLHSKWDHMMLQYAVIAGVIYFALHLVQIPNFEISKSATCKDFRLYSTALLSSFCEPWATGAFWHCFVSSTVVFWQQLCHTG